MKELFEKIYIRSEADLPKESRYYHCQVTETSGGYFYFNPDDKDDIDFWVGNIMYYLLPTPVPDKPSDEEIEKWAEDVDLFLLNTKVNLFMSELRRGIAIGIKAIRDGKIKSEQPETDEEQTKTLQKSGGYEGHCSKCDKVIRTNMMGNELGHHKCEQPEQKEVTRLDIINVLNSYLEYSSAHYSTQQIIAQAEIFERIANDIITLLYIKQAPRKAIVLSSQKDGFLNPDDFITIEIDIMKAKWDYFYNVPNNGWGDIERDLNVIKDKSLPLTLRTYLINKMAHCVIDWAIQRIKELNS